MRGKSTDWWKSSVIYQIYPQSFQDSNNDGIGDLNGIRSRLDYIQKLGADTIWLNPIYVSPLIDNGYDIADYRAIHPQYGTMEDFEKLLREAHEKGIRIIMDLVVNHTSDQHEWFKQSRSSRSNPYSDFYIWKDAKEDGSLPNNWGSTFGGPAWTYVPERDQYYLHCFAKEQPDLNWENPAVREAVYEDMRFWLDKGVDGFRMDVISVISKDPAFPDNDGRFPYTKSYYMGSSNGPRVHEFLQEMNEQVLSRYDVMTVGETPNTTTKQALLFTDPARKELNMVFQFEHMHLDYGKYGKFSVERAPLADLKENLSKWQNDLEQGWNSLYWNNHDQPRAVSRYGDDQRFRIESAKMLGTLLHGMKGTPFVYMGEEIGQVNPEFERLEDYQDIETRAFIDLLRENGESEEFIRTVCHNGSRDNARTPMQWDSNKSNYGFSKSEPWLPFTKARDVFTVEDALNDPNSVFYHYQKLIALRKELPVLRNGTYSLKMKDHPEIFAYKRANENSSLYIICSFADQDIPFSLSDLGLSKEEEKCLSCAKLLLSNYCDTPETLSKIQTLRPYEALMILFDKTTD